VNPDEAPAWYQYIYCAVCLELQDLGHTPAVAITIARGHAVCDEHRQRVDGLGGAVRGARAFLSRQQNGDRPPRRNYDRDPR
jgi:hypothetical protein